MSIANPSPTQTSEPLPLAGIRIVELANVVAGPSIGANLSDFGAEVIKVERPGPGDAARSMGERVGNRTAWWLWLGRNKQVITLDLKEDKDRDSFFALIGEADALVESFRPGVLERLGLGPDQLREVNPDLILVRVSAFGQSGPYADRPGFGTLAEAFSGLAEISGYPDRPPLLPPIALADQVAGLFGTWSLLAALYHRDVHGGPGQTIDLSLYESVLSLLGPLPTLYRHNKSLLGRHGSRLSFSSPRNVYETRDGRYFAVSGTAPAAAERIIELVGGEELATDPSFSTPEDRAVNADKLDAIVADWVAERDLVEVEADFRTAKAAGIGVIDMADAAIDPHYAARESVVAVSDEDLGEVFMTAPVPRFSATPGRIAHAGRPPGGNGDAVPGAEPAK